MEDCSGDQAENCQPPEAASKVHNEPKKDDGSDSPLTCNPSATDDLEEDLEKIKGDMIGKYRVP